MATTQRIGSEDLLIKGSLQQATQQTPFRQMLGDNSFYRRRPSLEPATQGAAGEGARHRRPSVREPPTLAAVELMLGESPPRRRPSETAAESAAEARAAAAAAAPKPGDDAAAAAAEARAAAGRGTP